MRRTLFVALFTTFLAVVSAASGWAQSGAQLFDYQVNAKVQTDQGTPVLILRAREFIERGEVKLERSDGDVSTVRLGKMKPGQEKRISFRQPKGTFKYRVTVTGESQFNQTMNATFETEVSWLDPIKLSVNPEQVQVGEGKLVMRSNVALDKVEIEVFDNNGKPVVKTTQSMGGRGGDLNISWSPSPAEVGAIRLTAYDQGGFWNAVVLEPFWVEIPHREVIFHFGKATWDDTETPKLKETLQGVRDAMKKHAKKGLQMQLYVVGYTDTVGSGADNIKLSTERARAIAQWFRKSGLELPILYQGFGEKVLAVNTPDNTPEPRNRRALYILGNAPPPRSGQIPSSAWKRL